MQQIPLPTQEPARPASSLAGRLLNIFPAPVDVFDELKPAPSSVANWLVPILIVTVVTIGSYVVTLSQPAIKQQIVEMKAPAIGRQSAG